MLYAREETCSNCEHNQTFNRYLTQFARKNQSWKATFDTNSNALNFWVKIIPAIIPLNTGMHERMFEKGNRKNARKKLCIYFFEG